MPLILPSNSISAVGYEVDNSLRFQDSSSEDLSRAIASTGSNQIYTVSAWVKRVELGQSSAIFGTGNGGADNDARMCFIDANDKIEISYYNAGYTYEVTTNRVLRDVSAWYHLCILFNSTESTSSDRIKIYVNGIQETSFETSSYPSLNASFNFGNTSYTHYVNNMGGRNIRGSHYIAELIYIDGTALDVSNFGEFDEDSGIWKPIDVSGLTFGTNGFYLDFENSGSLGADVSGNGNNFTVNNLTSIDQTTDTPTNNFATINPLFNDTANIATMSDGNLTILSTTGSWTCSPASLAFSSGKWYYEVKWLTGTGGDFVAKVGWGNPDKGKFMETQGSILYRNSNGQKYIDNSGSSYGATWTTANDIIGVAIDVDGGTVTFYKNGSSQGDITISGGLDDGTFIIPYIQLGNTDKVSVNFGNPPYTISSGNSDENGYGNFEYAPPSGYLALNTKNLSEFG